MCVCCCPEHRPRGSGAERSVGERRATLEQREEGKAGDAGLGADVRWSYRLARPRLLRLHQHQRLERAAQAQAQAKQREGEAVRRLVGVGAVGLFPATSSSAHNCVAKGGGAGAASKEAELTVSYDVKGKITTFGATVSG